VRIKTSGIATGYYEFRLWQILPGAISGKPHDPGAHEKSSFNPVGTSKADGRSNSKSLERQSRSHGRAVPPVAR
jgi:hypothetical protein